MGLRNVAKGQIIFLMFTRTWVQSLKSKIKTIRTNNNTVKRKQQQQSQLRGIPQTTTTIFRHLFIFSLTIKIEFRTFTDAKNLLNHNPHTAQSLTLFFNITIYLSRLSYKYIIFAIFIFKSHNYKQVLKTETNIPSSPTYPRKL